MKLVFTTADWDTPQTVTVTAIDDQGSIAEIGEGVYASTIIMSATTGDSFYSGLDYSDYDIDVEVIDASNRFYNGFTVSSMTGQTPWQWEKSTYADSGGVPFNADGTIEAPGPELANWAANVHKYGAKALKNVGNEGNNPGDYEDFNNMVDNTDGSRSAFVSSLLAYVQDNNLDGINFDIEWSEQIPPWLNYNLCLVETRAAFGNSLAIRCNVYSSRHEIKSNGFGVIDAVDIMSYNDFNQMVSYISTQKSYGASNSHIHGGMATGWLDPYGIDPALAAQKTQYCLDNGYGGVFLFGFDSEYPATSMLLAVRDTIINHYYTDYCQPASTGDLDGNGEVSFADFAIFAGYYGLEPDGMNAEDLIIFANYWLVDSSLIGYWELDESSGSIAADSTDCSKNGTLVNMEDSDWVAAGEKPGNALDFDGVDEYVEIAGYKGVTGSDPRTVAAWIKTNTTGEIITWGTNSAGKKWIFRVRDTNGTAGAIRVEVHSGYIVGNTDVRDGDWHHVAAVLQEGDSDVSDVKLYVDGVEETVYSAVIAEPINTAIGADVKIGVFSGNGGDRYFTGQIDDVRIYSRALSATEILNLAN